MLLADAKRGSHDGLGGGCSKQDDDPRPHHLDLGFEPGPAGAHLPRVRLLMQPPLAAPGPAEMLDGVGEVDTTPVDAGFVEAALQEPSGGADEGFSLQVLLVAGLLAD